MGAICRLCGQLYIRTIHLDPDFNPMGLPILKQPKVLSVGPPLVIYKLSKSWQTHWNIPVPTVTIIGLSRVGVKNEESWSCWFHPVKWRESDVWGLNLNSLRSGEHVRESSKCMTDIDYWLVELCIYSFISQYLYIYHITGWAKSHFTLLKLLQFCYLLTLTEH